MAEFLALHPISSLASDNFECAVVHRMGALQAELIHIHPNQTIPLHAHPSVDSVDLIVSGDIDLVISGKRIAEGYAKDRRTSFLRRAGLRIAANAPHGGSTGHDGVVFVSCQRWAIPPAHIALAWGGPPCTDAHARMLDSLAGIA